MSDIKVVDRRWWAKGENATSATAEEPSLKPSYVEELEKRLADKEQEIQNFRSQYREAAAGFDESRTRLRKETSKEIERGRRAVLIEFLEVLDNLDRAIDVAADALESGEASRNFEALLQGIVMVQQQFLAKLESFGVKRIALEGETFDPGRHEAVTTVPVQDPRDDGRIVGVVAHGYAIDDEVLRPAMVAVGKYSG
ncbi:MAG TPA: nucleotide exchange factor GrpE [Vicinamibacterales bacterium]|nr:nucleotide exchange factor GrpE [Vicinamibacterales bacterium]